MMKEILIICILILVIKLAKAQFVITTDTNNYFKTQLDSINNKESIETVNNFISDNNIPIQQFTIFNKRDTILNSNNATYWIKANSFKDENNKPVTDSITINIKEYFTKTDIVKANLSTQTADNKPLESAGMFKIEASKNNQKLKLIPTKDIQIKVLTANTDAKMKAFGSNDNGKTWFQAKDTLKIIPFNKANKKTSLVYELVGYKLRSKTDKNERWYTANKNYKDSLQLELTQKSFKINNVTFFFYEYKMLNSNKNFEIKRINNQDYVLLKPNSKYNHIGIFKQEDLDKQILWDINLVNLLPKPNELSQDIGNAQQFRFTLFLNTVIGKYDHLCPKDTIKTVTDFKKANPELNAYLLKINYLGMHNIDKYVSDDTLINTLKINAPIGSVIKLIFNKNRTVLTSQTDNKGIVQFNRLPENYRISIMCTYVEEDKILTSFSKVTTIEKNTEVNLLNEKFEGLDLKQLELVLKEM